MGPSSEEEHILLLDRGLTQPQKVKARHEHTSIKMLRDEERGYSLGRKRSLYNHSSTSTTMTFIKNPKLYSLSSSVSLDDLSLSHSHMYSTGREHY